MLIAVSSMEAYFKEALEDALSRTELSLSEQTCAYVVTLLAEFGRSESVYAGLDQGEKPTMAFFLAKAHEAEPEEAVRLFKHLGDSSLYFLGFFEDSGHLCAASPSYYIGMGETGYSSAAKLSRHQESGVSAVYNELSDHFAELVFTLNIASLHGERSSNLADKNPSYLLDLLERYRKSGKKELLELLMAHGVAGHKSVPIV